MHQNQHNDHAKHDGTESPAPECRCFVCETAGSLVSSRLSLVSVPRERLDALLGLGLVRPVECVGESDNTTETPAMKHADHNQENGIGDNGLGHDGKSGPKPGCPCPTCRLWRAFDLIETHTIKGGTVYIKSGVPVATLVSAKLIAANTDGTPAPTTPDPKARDAATVNASATRGAAQATDQVHDESGNMVGTVVGRSTLDQLIDAKAKAAARKTDEATTEAVDLAGKLIQTTDGDRERGPLMLVRDGSVRVLKGAHTCDDEQLVRAADRCQSAASEAYLGLHRMMDLGRSIAVIQKTILAGGATNKMLGRFLRNNHLTPEDGAKALALYWLALGGPDQLDQAHESHTARAKAGVNADGGVR